MFSISYFEDNTEDNCFKISSLFTIYYSLYYLHQTILSKVDLLSTRVNILTYELIGVFVGGISGGLISPIIGFAATHSLYVAAGMLGQVPLILLFFSPLEKEMLGN